MILHLVKINSAVSISVLTCIVAQSLPIGFPYYQFPTGNDTVGKKDTGKIKLVKKRKTLRLNFFFFTCSLLSHYAGNKNYMFLYTFRSFIKYSHMGLHSLICMGCLKFVMESELRIIILH